MTDTIIPYHWPGTHSKHDNTTRVDKHQLGLCGSLHATACLGTAVGASRRRASGHTPCAVRAASSALTRVARMPCAATSCCPNESSRRRFSPADVAIIKPSPPARTRKRARGAHVTSGPALVWPAHVWCAPVSSIRVSRLSLARPDAGTTGCPARPPHASRAASQPRARSSPARRPPAPDMEHSVGQLDVRPHSNHTERRLCARARARVACHTAFCQADSLWMASDRIVWWSSHRLDLFVLRQHGGGRHKSFFKS